ncbi:ABC-2 type transport system permease protein [Arthrobacter subterraneus]|uniref:ABC-2 type transport system permease protein n=1 Tax=Arthrobacter subterraneus TaxID=335973 RepID=A0A1G8MCC7_9MICC|nr:ABC-2 type transport system permease protein [Arthrobacter subterraneus]
MSSKTLSSSTASRKSVGWRFLGSELSVLFRRRRTWALLAALAAIPVLIAVAVKLSSGPPRGRGPAFLDQVSQNGLFVAVVATIVAIPLFLPLTVGVVAGDTVAGEASTGTLRYLLMSPVARGRLLAVKYAGAVVFCLAATFTVGSVGTLMGALLFPVGPVTTLSGTTIDVTESLVRIALVCLYVTLSLLGLCAVGLFMSTLTDVPVGAMAATVVASVVSQVVGQLPQLEWIHPWLLTHYWLGFADLLRDPVVWDSFAANAVLQAGYIVVFGALAYGRFSTKDVLA